MSRRTDRRLPLPGLSLPGLLAAVSLVAGLAAWELTAQEEQGRDPAAATTEFFDRVDVDIVNVEVFVTDRQGEPVRGLTADDFRIFEDGHERGISNFYAADGVRAIPEPEMVESLDDLLRDEPQEEAVLPPYAGEPLHLVLFVDNLNIRPAHRNRVLDAIRQDLLADLDPSTRVTLVGFDGKLEIKTLPTAKRRDIDQGLEDLVQGSAGGELDTLQRVSILRELQQVGVAQGLGTDRSGEELDSILSDMQVYAQRQSDRVRSTVGAISQLMSVLSGLEGHKALVYVSDGLSLNPGEALFKAYERKASAVSTAPQINAESEGRVYYTAPLFEQLGKQANASRVTFYTILAGGRGSVTLSPAERPAFVDLADATNLGRVWDESLESVEHSNQRGSMEILAAATGGRSTASSSDFSSALDDLRQDLRSYYSLGFRSDGPARDGSDRRIRVRVRNDDWVVRHRETFRSLGPDERMAATTRTALMLHSARDPLGIRVDFGTPQVEDRKLRKDEWLVPILIKFPIARLALVPGQSAHQGKVTIYVGTQGPNGDLSPVQKLEAPIQVPNDKMEAAMGQVAGYRMTLRMHPGEHRIAVTVRDEVADSSASILLTYEPSPNASRRPARGGAP